MKINIGKKNNYINKKSENTFLDYNFYIEACKIIAEDIKKNYDLNEIELVGIARGGLPMLVTISHMLGIREVSIIQTQMSNSDNCFDYGNFRYLNDTIKDSNKKCILLEDIMYKGVTTDGVIELLNKRKKKIGCVYSLVIDEKYTDINDKNNVDKKYVYRIKSDTWIYFLWEEDIRLLKE